MPHLPPILICWKIYFFCVWERQG